MVPSTIREASTVASLSLVWPWNSGSRMNTESMEAQVAITSSVVTAAMRFCWPTRSAWLAQAAQQGDAQAVLVGAAFGRRESCLQ
jgi:hypothetical protein